MFTPGSLVAIHAAAHYLSLVYPNINFAFVLPDLIADRLMLILQLIGSQRGWGRYNKHNVRVLIMNQQSS